MHVNNRPEPSSCVLPRVLTFAVYRQTHYVAATAQHIYLYYVHELTVYACDVNCVCVCMESDLRILGL